ncbi:MAG: hypothetical protein Crog4KO_21150 [Crocinitomicaceae bacterium]
MQASFDTWTSLFLLSSGFGFFLSIAIAFDRNNLRFNFPILLIVFGFSLVLVQYVFFWTGYRLHYPMVYFFDAFWYVIFGPLLYIYFYQWQKKLTWKQWLHLVPPLFQLAMLLYCYFKTSGFSEMQGVNEDPMFRWAFNFRAPWIPFFYLCIYGILMLEFLPSKAATKTPAKALQSKWMRTVFTFFWLFTAAYGSYYALSNFAFFNLGWDYAISISMSLGIYGIGFLALKQPSIFNGDLFQRVFNDTTKSKATLSQANQDDWFHEVQTTIREKSLFLRSDLRLIHVSEEVSIPLHDLSRLINDKHGENFNHFINSFRVEHAAELLTNDPNLTVLEICYMVGFNSKSTFYKAFKAKYGKTPQGYRESAS